MCIITYYVLVCSMHACMFVNVGAVSFIMTHYIL